MLHASEELRRLKSVRQTAEKRAKLARAHTHVLRAQCNDAYWHGVFGGLYAPHLRTEPWRELVRAETLAAEIVPESRCSTCVERSDFDADGAEELYVTSPRLAALLKPSDGGTLAALDYRGTSVTLINSMQRRVEAYHSRLSQASSPRPNQVASIHDQVRAKESGLERYQRYDRGPRSSFRALLIAPDKTFEDYGELRLNEHAALAGGAYAIDDDGPQRVSLELHTPLAENDSGANGRGQLRCTKHFSFAHEGAGLSRPLRDANSAYRKMCGLSRTRRGIEIILNFLAPDEPDRYFDLPSGRHPLRWAAAVPVAELRAGTLRLVDEWQNVAAAIEAPSAAHFWISPIETVSESEEGFERVYQGSQILLVWPVELVAGVDWRADVTLRIEPARAPRSQRRGLSSARSSPAFCSPIALFYSAINSVCAKGHSWSTHCASSRKPLRWPICVTSSGRYL